MYIHFNSFLHFFAVSAPPVGHCEDRSINNEKEHLDGSRGQTTVHLVPSDSALIPVGGVSKPPEKNLKLSTVVQTTEAQVNVHQPPVRKQLE